MFKKSTTLLVVMLLITILFSACAPAAPTAAPAAPTTAPAATEAPAAQAPAASSPVDKIKMAVVLAGLVNDGGFNSVGYQALNNAKQNLGVDAAYIENIPAAKAAGVMADYVNQGYQLIYGFSGIYQSIIFKIASEHPGVTFVAMAGPETKDSAPKNVWISGNAFEDAFYLAGALAGLTTKSNTLGFVGGAEIPVYKAAAKAFEEGAKSTNPNVKVLTAFTGNFNDAVKAKEVATAQIQQGADILMAAVNYGTFGVTTAAEAAENVKVIGMASDQKMVSPKTILTSIVLDYGGVMQEIIKNVAAGQPGGYAPINLASGKAYLAPYYGEVPDDIAKKVEEIKQKLISGEIKYTTAATLPKQ